MLKRWQIIVLGGAVAVAVLASATPALLDRLGLLGACCGSRRVLARADIAEIVKAAERYHARYGRYPAAEQGVPALVEVGYIESAPTDPWGRPYLYRIDGDHFRVISYGADGLPGGDGDAADVASDDAAMRGLTEALQPTRAAGPVGQREPAPVGPRG